MTGTSSAQRHGSGRTIETGRSEDVQKRLSKSLRAVMAHLKEELPAVRPGADLVPAVAWVGAAAVAMAAGRVDVQLRGRGGGLLQRI